MKKREDFAVSLRKKKTQEIINAKRRRLQTTNMEDQPEGSYKGYAAAENDPTQYENTMRELCPELYEDQAQFTLVNNNL